MPSGPATKYLQCKSFIDTNNYKTAHTAREHVIGKSEILNMLSCDRCLHARRFSLQLKIGWRNVLELAGLIRLRTRTFEAKNCQAVSADAVFCFLITISFENERTIHRGYYTVARRYEFYCFCHEKIKFISSSRRVMFFLLYRHVVSFAAVIRVVTRRP